jgi:hypothetical protein
MNHFDEKPFVFVEILTALLDHFFWYRRVKIFTTRDHLLELRVVRKVRIIHNVGHEGVASIKAGHFVVFLKNLAKAAISHNTEALQKQKVWVKAVNALGQRGPQLTAIALLDNADTMYYALLPYSEFHNYLIKEADRFLELKV